MLINTLPVRSLQALKLPTCEEKLESLKPSSFSSFTVKKSQILRRKSLHRDVDREQLLRLGGNKNKAVCKEIHLKCLIYSS